MPVGALLELARDLQQLMFGGHSASRRVWNAEKQASVSPADLQQDLELLMRKYGLVPSSSMVATALERATLSRAGYADLAAIITAGHGTIEISFPGYSDKGSEFGPVIYIELNEQGHPQLCAWTDISDEAPTHVLSFAGAMDMRMTK